MLTLRGRYHYSPSCKNNQRKNHCLISDCPSVSVLGHTFTRFGHRKCSKFFRIECLVTFAVQQELYDAYGDEQCSKSPVESHIYKTDHSDRAKSIYEESLPVPLLGTVDLGSDSFGHHLLIDQ